MSDSSFDCSRLHLCWNTFFVTAERQAKAIWDNDGGVDRTRGRGLQDIGMFTLTQIAPLDRWVPVRSCSRSCVASCIHGYHPTLVGISNRERAW